MLMRWLNRDLYPGCCHLTTRKKGTRSMDIKDIESQHVGSKDDGASIGLIGSEDCASIGVDVTGDGASIRVIGSQDCASIDVDDGTDQDGTLSSDGKDPHRPLLNTIGEMFKTLVPPLTSECCIYRIPAKLRKINEAAYTPQAISIGPFHHGKENVQIMEKHKERYLYQFIQRDGFTLEDAVSCIKECEERVRRCYAEPIKLTSDELVKMILLDGSFIIEFFLKYNYDENMDENDEVLYKPWLSTQIRNDLIFLENQLPLFVFEKLYNLAAFTNVPNDDEAEENSKKDFEEDSFLEIACQYFGYFNQQEITPQVEVKHFTDLIRTFHLPSSPRLAPKEKKVKVFSNTAMELHQAGVKFKVSSSKCLFDIHFTNGVLQIPFLKIHDDTECVVRNLMALEQCHYPDQTYICDYFDVMNTLINTEKDVELLVQNGIIFNWLGGHHVLAAVINNLGREIVQDLDKTYFGKLGEDLIEYYENPWHSWKASLKREYFSTPWKIASVVAAAILLLLTLMQTTNSFISL